MRLFYILSFESNCECNKTNSVFYKNKRKRRIQTMAKTCVNCGKEAIFLFRTKLADKNYLCKECAKIIPSYMKKSVKQHYRLEDYRDLKAYIEYSNLELRTLFQETDSYETIHLDQESGIFYIGYGIDEKTMFFEFANVTSFDLVFKAEEYKDGVFREHVKGKVLMELEVESPFFHHEEIILYSAKAKARKALFGSKVRYENPKGMDMFLQTFIECCIGFRETEAFKDYSDNSNNEPSALQRAMALFMIDKPEDITTERIKRQRNRLIKTFHPDLCDEYDAAEYAQKINAAYEILMRYLK